MNTPHDDFGAGPAIVLLHGFPFNRSMWREQNDFLSGHGCRVIAPDLRGLGENVAQTSVCEPPGSVDHRLKSVPLATMEVMARDVAALMDESKIDSAVICGLSMGCYVAFELIHNFPSRVKALVLCGPRAQGPDEAEKASRGTSPEGFTKEWALPWNRLKSLWRQSRCEQTKGRRASNGNGLHTIQARPPLNAGWPRDAIIQMTTNIRVPTLISQVARWCAQTRMPIHSRGIQGHSW
jgi:pimeloyl-ACP methyl ester carboxylesterase